MKALETLCVGLFLLTMIAQSSYAQQSPQPPTETIHTATSHTAEQQEIINLSKKTWDWLADKNVDSLDNLFDDKAMFVHMGGTWGKTQELEAIKAAASGTRKLQFTQLQYAYLVTRLSCWMTLICRPWSVDTPSPALLW